MNKCLVYIHEKHNRWHSWATSEKSINCKIDSGSTVASFHLTKIVFGGAEGRGCIAVK